jgi:hypothetical protein
MESRKMLRLALKKDNLFGKQITGKSLQGQKCQMSKAN